MMSDAFTGFSDDDIRKLQNGTAPNKPNENEIRQIKSSLKSTVKTSSKGNETKTKRVIFSKTLSSDNMPVHIPIPDAAKLDNVVAPVAAEETRQAKPDENITEPSHKQEQNNEQTQAGDKLTKTSEKKFVDLEEFKTRQKLIEEQNRRRKELLAKALADRTKQTQEETIRLNGIRNEFKKLDAVISSDVKILRQKIEVASVDYMETQKRYRRVEKEFLETKLALQQKLEKKEMLTEHLCAIIEQNEDRKAKKLTELLEKLERTGDIIDDVQCDDNKSGADIQVSEITTTDPAITNSTY